jgi:SAM-dependent methyltransferase
VQIEDVDFDLLCVTPDSRILDVGCGRGSVLLRLWENKLLAVGIDIGKNYLDQIRIRHSLGSGGSLLQCSAEHLCFKPKTFDIIICREVMEHLLNPLEALHEFRKVIKPNGRLCITIPYYITEYLFNKLNPSWLSISQHRTVFSLNKIKAMIEQSNFDLIKIKRERFFYTYFWFFHCLFRTPHDGTGRPSHNFWLTKILFAFWGLFKSYRICQTVIRVCNQVLPKSIYIYCEASNRLSNQDHE